LNQAVLEKRRVSGEGKLWSDGQAITGRGENKPGGKIGKDRKRGWETVCKEGGDDTNNKPRRESERESGENIY